MHIKFAFDFHGVIVSEPFTFLYGIHRISEWNLYDDLKKIFLFLVYLPFKLRFNSNLPFFIFASFEYILHSLNIHFFSGAMYAKLCNDYEQYEFLDHGLRLANNVTPLKETIKIMKELKELGYEIDITSNMDSEVWRYIEEEESKRNDDIKEIITLINHKMTISLEQPFRKPSPIFFKDYKGRVYNAHKKDIIFIDDNKENVTIANEMGLTGIHFITSYLLRLELTKLGILPKSDLMVF